MRHLEDMSHFEASGLFIRLFYPLGGNHMIHDIVENLLKSYESHPELTNLQKWALPSRKCVTDLTLKLESLLYPGLIECIPIKKGLPYIIGHRVTEVFTSMIELVTHCLEYAANCSECRIIAPNAEVAIETQAEELVNAFFMQLPQIRELIKTDLHAAYKGDPAAKSYAEIILAYPGLRALALHRLAHILYEQNVPILPRMMSEYVHNRTGIDIHPGAKIGSGLFIDHGTGVVIGETTVIGNDVKIYQGVTLGALSIPDPDAKDVSLKRHPTIEDNVTIYANATILGGNTVVGARSIIGSNVWLTRSVPADSKVLFIQPDLRIKTMSNE